MKTHSHSDSPLYPVYPAVRMAYGSPRYRVPISFTGNGRTKQSMKDECDINTILSRFQRTGVLDFVEKRSPQFGDTTGIEFQNAMDTIVQAKAMFADLPSKLRQRFNNEPERLLEFLEDPSNRAEAVLLGLVKAPATPVATPASESTTSDSKAVSGDSRV